MISVINPSQYGAFPRPSGVVHYPDFYSYHLTTTATASGSTTNSDRQNSVLDQMTSRVATSTCQFANNSNNSSSTTSSGSSSNNSRTYFSSTPSGSTTRLSSSQSSSGCVQPSPSLPPRGLVQPTPGKDYSKPLFVDCSIEYELPNAPKIPKNSSPILMIPPTYQKKLIAQQQQQQQQQQQIQQQRSSPCSGPQCRQCQEASLMRKQLKVENGDIGGTNSDRKATKRTYSSAIETSSENIYKHSIQGN